MNYVIGVDGGGTKTEAVAYSLEGEVLESTLTGFGNLVNGRDEALKNITDSIEGLVNKLGRDGLKGLYLGIAGSEVSDNAKVIEDEVKEKFGFSSKVMNDGDLALKALLKGEDGILVIAGTGSIAFGINGANEKRVGGWGHLLGDEGSAYKISIEAFKIMIKEDDYGLERSELSKDILEKLNIKEVSNIIDFVYSSTKDEIAQMAGLVSKHAELGNEDAKAILVNEGIEIGKSAERVFKALEFEKCSIGLVGGVIRKSKILRTAFENYLNENIKVKSFVDDSVSPAIGAYYIYKKENR
ncbi:MAG: N-acetylglucosamine kinase [Clostridium sp.]|uniref:N-acetylglucosamine kinase n=1 Tax=Clostridium sp. TaxID=1506 RepID=UPI003F363E6C